MKVVIISLMLLALLFAGLLSMSMSVPLEAPSLLLLGMAAILASALVFRANGKNPQESSEGTMDKSFPWLLSLIAISVAYFIARAYFSPVFDLGVEDLILILSASILYLLAGHLIVGKSAVVARLGLAWIILILLLLHIGSSWLQIRGGEGYSLTRYFTLGMRSSSGKVTGMYGYYGSFANFAVIASFLALSLSVWGRSRLALRGFLFLLGLVGFSLALFSQSRSAAISMIIALIVFLMLLAYSVTCHSNILRKRVYKICFSLVGIVLLGGSTLVYWVFNERARGTSKDSIEMVFDSMGRLPFWSMAAEQWVEHPWIGSGSRSYSYECFRYWSPNLPTSATNPEFVHNEYLQLLADYGLVGLVLIVSLLMGHCLVGCKQMQRLRSKVEEDALKRGSNAVALTMAGICGMIVMAIHICFDFRTHLLPNLLLLICCAVWVLPVRKPKVPRHRMGTWGLALIMLCLGTGALGLAAQQLWAGLPLIKNKVAKEDGAWVPQEVDRDIGIPVLEKSLSRAPQWRRYQRLGALYQLQAASEELKVDKEKMFEKAKLSYLASIERHPFNPISKIDLAGIYSQEGRWNEADSMYASASELARAREYWFRMHSKWAWLHFRWAYFLREDGQESEAKLHFERAKELYLDSYNYGYFYLNREWIYDYGEFLISYAGVLDEMSSFEESEALFEMGEKYKGWHPWMHEMKFYYFWGRHLYLWAMKRWNERKPEEALSMMREAKKRLLEHQFLVKKKVDDSWRKQMKDVQEVINFLEGAGVK